MRRHLHFSIASRYMTAAEITVRVGIEPDEVAILGSLQQWPPIPAAHAWTITCQNAGLDPDEQLVRILARLAPRMDTVLELCAELAAQDPLRGGASLELVDYPRTPRASGPHLATVPTEHPEHDRQVPSLDDLSVGPSSGPRQVNELFRVERSPAG
jgi:hypothetical protein